MTTDSNQLNTVTIATSSPNGNVVASPTYRSDGIPTASVATRSTNNLINGNMPNICPRWITKNIAPTQTTNRYRGKYDGCYSYDGLIAKGVSDVRLELYINIKHREPTGDPLTNKFQSQDPNFSN